MKRAWMALVGVAACAQQNEIAPRPAAVNSIVRPYSPVDVPAARLSNSPRLDGLIRAGTLYLSAKDAVALALENDIDLEIARYNSLISEWNVKRAEAGGALPGVPNNASQAGSVAVGQGVTGSQQAAGVKIVSTGGNGNTSANATVSQIGPVAQTLDPIVQEASTFSHTSTPQPNVVQSITPNLVTDTHAHSASIQDGLLTGGSVVLKYTDNYLNENSPTDLLNPSTAPNLSITFSHNLLRGFGVAVNERFIRVAKINTKVADLDFRARVSGLVSQVLMDYYNLAAAYEDVKAKRSAAETALEFFRTVKGQVELGAVAPPEAITAESLAVSSGQTLVDAETTLRQQELRMKNLLSRVGTGDPALMTARILPVDPIAPPGADEFPPLEQMVKMAAAARSDLLASRVSNEASEVSSLGTRNGLLPTLQVFGGESQAGLAGSARPGADAYFSGGVGTGLAQVLRRNFPTERVGAAVFGALRNRQAQADYAIDQLQNRQSDLTTQKAFNQVEVDVENYVVALEQARARYETAMKSRALHQELYTGEQRRYELGASTPYNVIQQQRDLVAAEAEEMAARVQYTTARIGLDQVLGRTLEANGVKVEQVRR